MQYAAEYLWVNTRFRGAQVGEFELVKRHLGVEANAEVIRILVRREARALRMARAIEGEGETEREG